MFYWGIFDIIINFKIMNTEQANKKSNRFQGLAPWMRREEALRYSACLRLSNDLVLEPRRHHPVLGDPLVDNRVLCLHEP